VRPLERRRVARLSSTGRSSPNIKYLANKEEGNTPGSVRTEMVNGVAHYWFSDGYASYVRIGHDD
jgi:hypothetical protein